MGLFTPPPPAAPTPSPDGSFEAPNRTARAHCWRARDAFFACLERNGIVDSIKDAEGARAACGTEGRGFEAECKGSWVTYFKQRRVMEFHKKNTLERLVREGVKPVPGGTLPEGIQGKPTGG